MWIFENGKELYFFFGNFVIFQFNCIFIFNMIAKLHTFNPFNITKSNHLDESLPMIDCAYLPKWGNVRCQATLKKI